jgi:hypothetical protein
VRNGKRRIEQRRHRVEEALHREGLEKALVPVALEADELAGRLQAFLRKSKSQPCSACSTWSM